MSKKPTIDDIYGTPQSSKQDVLVHYIIANELLPLNQRAIILNNPGEAGVLLTKFIKGNKAQQKAYSGLYQEVTSLVRNDLQTMSLGKLMTVERRQNFVKLEQSTEQLEHDYNRKQAELQSAKYLQQQGRPIDPDTIDILERDIARLQPRIYDFYEHLHIAEAFLSKLTVERDTPAPSRKMHLIEERKGQVIEPKQPRSPSRKQREPTEEEMDEHIRSERRLMPKKTDALTQALQIQEQEKNLPTPYLKVFMRQGLPQDVLEELTKLDELESDAGVNRYGSIPSIEMNSLNKAKINKLKKLPVRYYFDYWDRNQPISKQVHGMEDVETIDLLRDTINKWIVNDWSNTPQSIKPIATEDEGLFKMLRKIGHFGNTPQAINLTQLFITDNGKTYFIS